MQKKNLALNHSRSSLEHATLSGFFEVYLEILILTWISYKAPSTSNGKSFTEWGKMGKNFGLSLTSPPLQDPTMSPGAFKILRLSLRADSSVETCSLHTSRAIVSTTWFYRTTSTQKDTPNGFTSECKTHGGETKSRWTSWISWSLRVFSTMEWRYWCSQKRN
jgi:hypothetical protein